MITDFNQQYIMNELNNLIDKALDKAKQDLNNEKIEVNYTPEFLIELLQEIKAVAKREEVVNVG